MSFGTTQPEPFPKAEPSPVHGPSGPGRLLLWVLPLVYLIGFFFVPFGRILAYSFSWQAFNGANLTLAFQTLLFTLYQAALSTVLTLLVGIPAAYLFARFEFPAKPLLRALT